VSEPVLIIANPNAAGGRGARKLPRLQRILEARGIAYLLETTTGPGHARELAHRAARNGTGRLLVVGGDGTVHEVANGLLEAGGRPDLAVCPVGTGNDFYRMVHGPRDPCGVVDVLERGVSRSFEVGRVRWEGGEVRFVNLLGLGIDVEVLRRRSRFRHLPGLLQYGGALLQAATRFRPVPVAVEIETADGRVFRTERETLLTTVTVGPSVAGGIRVSPAARPDDGALDLLLVEGLGFFALVRHLPRVFRGTHDRVPEVHMERIRRARIETGRDSPLHFELDGELMPEPSTWLEIEVEPDRLSVLELPRGRPS
jgi:diacylglycerol kinase (ATP)